MFSVMCLCVYLLVCVFVVVGVTDVGVSGCWCVGGYLEGASHIWKGVYCICLCVLGGRERS